MVPVARRLRPGEGHELGGEVVGRQWMGLVVGLEA